MPRIKKVSDLQTLDSFGPTPWDLPIRPWPAMGAMDADRHSGAGV